MELVKVNEAQRLYVIRAGKNSLSCYGFDVAERKGSAVAAWLGEDWPALPIGTAEHFTAFDAVMARGAEHNARAGQRCNAELVPELIGLEGSRVEVIFPGGEKTRFQVGKSTGWIPCHLGIARRDSSGGSPVYFPAGSTVRVIRKGT